MSLRDTINGARAEAAAAGAARVSTPDEANSDAKTEQDAEGDKGGFAKRSVARAKPAREAAANVRVVSTSGKTKSKGSKVGSTQTREQRKAERAKERDELDREDAVTQILLENDPLYKPRRRVWWTLIGIGFATMALSLLPMGIDSDAAQDYTSPLGIASIVFMMICYVAIIAAFVYDFVKIRPMRKQSQRTAEGLTRKAMQKVLDDDRRSRAAAKEAKKSK